VQVADGVKKPFELRARATDPVGVIPSGAVTVTLHASATPTDALGHVTVVVVGSVPANALAGPRSHTAQARITRLSGRPSRLGAFP
jgi:hypothetical protein